MSVNVINRGARIYDNVLLLGTGTLIINEGSEIRSNTVLEFGNGNVTIGKNSVIGFNSFIQASGELVIGNGSLIGPGTSIICSNHGTNLNNTISNQPLIRGNVIIDDDVWVGANCTIGYNTIIEKGCILGANSFLNKSIPSLQVWGGVPAKFIKVRI